MNTLVQDDLQISILITMDGESYVCRSWANRPAELKETGMEARTPAEVRAYVGRARRNNENAQVVIDNQTGDPDLLEVL